MSSVTTSLGSARRSGRTLCLHSAHSKAGALTVRAAVLGWEEERVCTRWYVESGAGLVR